MPPKPKPKDMYHKILAYDMPPGESTITTSLSTNCLNHTAEEVRAPYTDQFCNWLSSDHHLNLLDSLACRPDVHTYKLQRR